MTHKQGVDFGNFTVRWSFWAVTKLALKTTDFKWKTKTNHKNQKTATVNVLAVIGRKLCDKILKWCGVTWGENVWHQALWLSGLDKTRSKSWFIRLG